MTARGPSGNVREADPGDPRAMTKSELIAELADANPHLRAADVELIVGTIFDEITQALARGERVELRGFGAFTIKHRNARTGRNPRTGEAVPVDEVTTDGLAARMFAGSLSELFATAWKSVFSQGVMLDGAWAVWQRPGG